MDTIVYDSNHFGWESLVDAIRINEKKWSINLVGHSEVENQQCPLGGKEDLE